MQEEPHFSNEEYFERYLLEELSPDEITVFEHKLQSEREFAQAYLTFKNKLSPSDNSSVDYDSNSSWEAIEKRIYDPSIRDVNADKSLWRWRGAASIAAVVVIGFLGLWLILPNSQKEIELITKATADGQKATVTLIDGTTIRLNSSSSISYPEEFTDSSRVIFLTGEAFFDVTPDKTRPFIIYSGEMKTTVLGTSFNIRAFADENDQQVAVKTGVVQVNFENQELNPVKLQVGDLLNFDTNLSDIELLKVNAESIAMWTQGYIYFDNERLEQVLKSLSRWYGVKFSVENPQLLDCKITLRQRDENLKNILEILKYASNVDYEFIDNQIIIKGKKC
jgi:ferric-dicitrate binding protein FerR (iron transport regulator)